MTEGQWGFLIFGAIMMLFAPLANAQGIKRIRRARTEGVKKVMLSTENRLPDNASRRIAIGAVLAIAWLVLWWIAFNA